MDDNLSVPMADEGCDASAKEGKKRKKRSRSNSSVTSDSSSSCSTSTSSSDGKHKRHSKNKRRKRRRYENRKFDKLFSELNNLKKQVAFKKSYNCEIIDDVDKDDCVSLDLNDNWSTYSNDHASTSASRSQESTAVSGVTLSLSTKTKEPIIAHACPQLLEQLKDLQRFESPDWNNVRYADAQKLYLQSPGFTNLEANEEVKRYEQSKTNVNMEKAFASLTCTLLQQRNALQSDLNTFLSKVKQERTLNYDDVNQELNNAISNGEYIKTFNDALQIVCGHRAELVQHRREGILSAVKDPIHKNSLRKIVPNCSHLFDPEKFTAAVDKAGGVRKVFWNKEKDHTRPSYTHTQQKQCFGPPQHKKPTQGQQKLTNKKHEFSFHGYSKKKPNKRETDNQVRNKSPPSSHRERRYTGRKF